MEGANEWMAFFENLKSILGPFCIDNLQLREVSGKMWMI